MPDMNALALRLAQTESGPLYMRLASAFRDAILSGELQPNAALPAERALSDAFRISRVTVRKALGMLLAEGLIVTRRGSGTTVAARPRGVAMDAAAIWSGSPFSDWESVASGPATASETMDLALLSGTPIVRLVRSHLRDGVPVGIERAVVPAVTVADEGRASSRPLYEAMGRHRPVRLLERVRAIVLSAADCELLDAPRSSAALVIERRGFCPVGVPVLSATITYRGDRHEILLETFHG